MKSARILTLVLVLCMVSVCFLSGTVAKYISMHNIDVVDLGVPVIAMHAPFEVISKVDLYEAYRAFCAFCKF